MPEIVVIGRSGEEHLLSGSSGLSLMENIREHGIDELLALCGGCCSCATCHVYVDPDFIDKLPAMSEDEDELLDGTVERRSESRLSCQIQVGDHLAGLRVTIAPDS